MGRVSRLVLALVAVLAQARPGVANDLPLRRALHAASVQVLTTGCSAALAENRQIVVTARHCLRGDTLRLRFSTGEERTGWVVATNQASDQAVLFLEEPVAVQPLTVVRRRQVPGTVLYFEGNPDRPRFQSARLDRVGRCPSLPDLPNALFTSIEGVPGDSGAPLIDAAGRVVGLVHGGTHCHIATPADSLARLVDRVLEREPTDVGGATGDSDGPRGDSEASHLRVQGLAGDAEAAGGGALGGLLLQALADERQLDTIEDAVERLLDDRRVALPDAACEVLARDALAGRAGQHQAVHLVLELAHVTRPRVRLQGA
jgi:S1-C subfamily serine protease